MERCKQSPQEAGSGHSPEYFNISEKDLKRYTERMVERKNNQERLHSERMNNIFIVMCIMKMKI